MRLYETHGRTMKTDLYAHVVPHVQPSGTGKSRAHDELAKHILCIPLNLAGPGASSMLPLHIPPRSLTSLVLAYPPRDPQVEQWFAASNNPTEQGTQDRCHAFLHALLFTTLSHLREICDDKAVFEKIQAKPFDRVQILASEFRSRMANGRTFEAHGEYRTKFYDNVSVRAQQVVLPSFPSIQQTLLMSPLRI